MLHLCTLLVLLLAALSASAQYSHRHERTRLVGSQSQPVAPTKPLPPVAVVTIDDEPFRSSRLPLIPVADSVRGRKVVYRPPKPGYPVQALRDNVEGAVFTRVLVAPDGHVTAAGFVRFDHYDYENSPRPTDGSQWVLKLKEGSGRNQLEVRSIRLLAAEAARYCRQMRFAPAAQETLLEVVLTFQIL